MLAKRHALAIFGMAIVNTDIVFIYLFNPKVSYDRLLRILVVAEIFARRVLSNWHIPWSLRLFNIINCNLGGRTYLTQLTPSLLIGLFYCRSSGKSVDK